MSLPMPTPADTQIPSDIVLMLRADAEQRWLNREVIPVLHQIEGPKPLPREQADAALAYLESSWSAARARARQTDAAHDLSVRARAGGALGADAARYHTAVRALRGLVAERVGPYVEDDFRQEPACARIA